MKINSHLLTLSTYSLFGSVLDDLEIRIEHSKINFSKSMMLVNREFVREIARILEIGWRQAREAGEGRNFRDRKDIREAAV